MSSTKTFFVATLLATLAAAAIPALAAGDNQGAPQSSAPAASQQRALTRAEVLADLQIYRESGLAQVEQSEGFGLDLQRRREAQAKYAQLRQSPYYASLVKLHGGKVGDTDVAAAR